MDEQDHSDGRAVQSETDPYSEKQSEDPSESGLLLSVERIRGLRSRDEASTSDGGGTGRSDNADSPAI